jgi:hypothetical protein
MRACTQCGLSISETATFCAVCGARADPAADMGQAPAPEVAAAAEPEASVEAVAPAPEAPPATPTEAPEAPAATPTEAPDEPVAQAPETPAEPAATTVETQIPGAAEAPPSVPETTASRRRREASLPMVEAERLEKTEPLRSAALYREAIIGLLESAAEPLDHEGVRRDLLQIFDRLSVVLKRAGLPEEALEEIDCAASLGLLDCQDQGIKGHREALKKRRESLQRSLDGRPPAAT